MKELLKDYQIKKQEIKKRLEYFKSHPENQHFIEFQFCLLTPQSNAQRCWQAVQELSVLKNPTSDQVHKILSTKTRFHNTKTKRILQAQEKWKEIKPLLKNQNRLELRNQIAKTVNGYGLKEAGHFLRNIGKSDNQFSILDRHILRNLYELKIIDSPKIRSPKHYLELEQAFLNFAKNINIPADELDLLWWSKENGEIFK